MKCEHSPVDNLSTIKQRISVLEQQRFLFNWDDVMRQEKDALKTLPPLHEPTGIRTRERIIELYKNDITREIEYLLKQTRSMSIRKNIKKRAITGEQVAQAKNTDIQSLISFNRGGFAKCIWHNEDSPSMKYYKKTNSVHCFGCGKSADAIDVYMQLHEPILFLDAVRAMLISNS